MIFHETWKQVLDRTKTQTRRLVKNGDYFSPRGKPYADTAYVLGNKRMRFSENRTYAVQPGRGKKGIGFIGITKIRRERLQEISNYDIKAEGVNSLSGFIILWNELHPKGKRWEDNPKVWVLEFELVNG